MDETDQMDDLGLDSDDLWNRVKLQESNNSHLQEDGRVTTSPKGAMGAAQIMPQTAMQPGNNVPTIFDMARDMGIPVGAETEDVAKELLANEELNRSLVVHTSMRCKLALVAIRLKLLLLTMLVRM